MKRKAKVSVVLILIVVVSVAAAVVYIINNLDFIVARIIEQEGTRVTQTQVNVDKVRIGLREGSASIAGIRVANPSGFEHANAFSLGQISTDIDLKSLTGSPIVIEHVTVEAPAVTFEVTEDRRINLNELKNNIVPAGGGTAKPKETGAGEGAQVKLIIRRLSMKGGTLTARLTALEDKTRQLELPAFEFTNLGGPGGATPAQLTREILDKLIARVRETIKQQAWAKQLEGYQQKAKQKLEQEKQKIEQKKQQLKSEADQKLDQQKQKAEDKLKNLLDR